MVFYLYLCILKKYKTFYNEKNHFYATCAVRFVYGM